MKPIKTITVNGVTYQVQDEDAASIDNTKVGEDAWSSKNIVDKLCPSFTESGAIVTCEPVEGYPLDVVWQGKNIIDFFNYSKYQNLPVINSSGTNVTKKGYLLEGLEVGKTYTVSLSHKDNTNLCTYLYLYIQPEGKPYSTRQLVTEKVLTPVSFTVEKDTRYIITRGGTYVISQSDLAKLDTFQIEKGNIATAYEPYAETATITRCGKNLCSLGTQTFTRYKACTNDVILPVGNYYFSANVETTDTDATSVAVIFYSMDGSETLAAKYPVHTSGTIRFTFTLPKPTSKIYLYASSSAQSSANDTATYSDIQIVPGSAQSAFEPFSGGTFNPGETILALPGVNIIYADVGEVTVTGRTHRIENASSSDTSAVKYTAQSLPTTAQAQARANIGAAAQADLAVLQNTILEKMCPTITEIGEPLVIEPVPGTTFTDLWTTTDVPARDVLADGAWKNGDNWHITETEWGETQAIYYFPLEEGNITVNYMTRDLWPATLYEVDVDGILQEQVVYLEGNENGVLETYEATFGNFYGSGKAAIMFSGTSWPWEITPVLEVWHKSEPKENMLNALALTISNGTETKTYEYGEDWGYPAEAIAYNWTTGQTLNIDGSVYDDVGIPIEIVPLPGINTLQSSIGATEVTYKTYPAKVIEKLQNEIAVLKAQNEITQEV